jgi:hypothetical protein
VEAEVEVVAAEVEAVEEEVSNRFFSLESNSPHYSFVHRLKKKPSTLLTLSLLHTI